MISLRSSAGVRVAPATAVASSSSASRAAIALRSAAPALSSTSTMMPARVSSSSRRSLKSLAPRAAAGSPPAFGAYGEKLLFSSLHRESNRGVAEEKRRDEALRAKSDSRCSFDANNAIFFCFFSFDADSHSLDSTHTHNRRRRPHHGHRCRRRRR